MVIEDQAVHSPLPLQLESKNSAGRRLTVSAGRTVVDSKCLVKIISL